MKLGKISNSLNTLSLVTTLLILVLCYWARTGMPVYVSPFSYVSLFALASTIFCLPDFICHYFPSKNSWFRTTEFYTIFLILILSTAGLFFSNYSFWISFMIVPVGIALASWQLSQFIREKSFLLLSAGLIFMVFIILLFYSLDYHNFLFPEKIISGKGHIDVLFFSSMGSMFSTLGWASTGIDGAPYIPYHWGAYAVMGGLKTWTGINMLMFINVAYPAIFLPLFIKSLFSFLQRLTIYKGVSPVNILFAFAFLVFVYSLPLAGFQFASPMSSESFSIAIIFTFLYASNVISFISGSHKNRNLFFLYSMSMILLIFIFKISNGFLCLTGMAYFYLRVYNNYKNFMIAFTGMLIIAVFIYLFIYPTDRSTFSVPLTHRISNFWYFSVSFITYLSGALIAMIIILKNKSLENWQEVKSMIRSGEFLDLEILFIITLAGFLAGMYVSSNGTDVYFFCSIQLILSIPVLILITQRYFERFRASDKVKTVFLFLVIALSFISRPDIIKGVLEIPKERNEMLTLTPQQNILKRYISELFWLEKARDRKTKCIYIPQTEKWYYESQSYRPLGSPFVTPAISGIAMIEGIPDYIKKINRVYYYYGYYYYKNNEHSISHDITEVKNSALKKGYKELIAYQVVDGKLNKETYILNRK